MAFKDEALRLVVRSTLERVWNIVFRSAKKRQDAAEETGDHRRVEIELERLEDAISSLEGRLAELGDGANWRFANEEASDPGFADFTDEALRATAASGSEAKRLMLGRMIAERLFTPTGDPGALNLNRALRTVVDMTDEQLRLLGKIALFQEIPSKQPPKAFSSRDEAERWLRERYSGLVESWTTPTPFLYEDLETLASFGAIRIEQTDSMSSHATSIEAWLMSNGVAPHDGVEGEIGTRESHEKFRKRFPTITALERIAAGTEKSRLKKDGQRLDDLILTPLGDVIGRMVVGQSLQRYSQQRCSIGP